MVSVYLGNDLTTAIINVLTSAGFTVGDGEAPSSAGWQGAPSASPFVPYVDVHPIPGGASDGTISDPDADASTDFQLVCVGATRAQAETVGDEVREVMLATPITLPTSRTMAHIRIEMYGGAVRDDTVLPAVYMVNDRYRVLTVPS